MWYYQDKEFDPEEAGNYTSFVYLITNLENGMKYIGKKSFTFKKRRQKNKKIKKYLVESDWSDYFGSNEILKKEVEELGSDKFRREILHLCKNKAEASYLEAKEQFVSDALIREDYYNSWISVRVRTAHLRKFIERVSN